MKPDVVLFDLDGTLLDHATSVSNALSAWVPTVAGRPLASTDVEAWLAAENRHFPAWRSGDVTFGEQRRRRLRDFLPTLGIQVNHDEVLSHRGERMSLDRCFDGYLEAYSASWVAFPDAHDALASLARHGHRLALLTNGITEQQRAKVSALRLETTFEAVFTAESLGVAKPDRRAFHQACSRLDVSPDSVVYVGDDPDVDVRAALAAGLQAIHVDRTGASPFTPERCVRTLLDLPAAITAL